MSDLPNRRSIRLRDYDYSSGSTYFVTNCAARRTHMFGEVRDNQMHLSRFGEIVQSAWDTINGLRRELVPHAFIVMPNHFHALFSLDPEAIVDLRPPNGPEYTVDQVGAHGVPPRKRHSVSTIMGGMKGDVTRQIRKLIGKPRAVVWQERYYEHIVRDNQEFDTIARYIETNPENWENDRFFA